MFITYGYNIYDNNGTQKGGGNGANVLYSSLKLSQD